MDKDLLIFPASLILWPWAFVYFCLSLPAKSTRCNLEVLVIINPPSISNEDIKNSVYIKWDLEDSLFILVEATCLFLNPDIKASFAFLAELISNSVKFSIYIPFFGSSLIFKESSLLSKALLLFDNKSIKCSW